MYKSPLASAELQEGENILAQLTQQTVQLRSGESVAFPGDAEKIILQNDRVSWEVSGLRCVGSIVLTNFRMALLPGPRVPGTTDMPLNMEVPWGVVDLLKLLPGSALVRTFGQNVTQDLLEIHCKDFRVIHLRVLEGSCEDLHDQMMQLQSGAQQRSLSRIFVESQGPTGNWLPSPWEAEFERQGLDMEAWRQCTINEEYAFTPSYPSSFWVPANVSDETIKVAATYRSKGRLPLLTWRHPDKGSLLLRCAQPHAGASSQSADKELLEAARSAAGQDAHLVFFDCRSGTAAAANSWRDGGTERPHLYSWMTADGQQVEAEILQLELDNIHAMRASWLALLALIHSCISERDWLSRLNETRWLEHCRRVTEAAQTVARCLHGNPMSGAQDSANVVVVHCSEGWDRTSQVCALAQLLLDPHYRTAEGFCLLIEKDWIMIGHKFRDRIDSQREKDRSPIFLQWLFCVAAVQAQMPQAFEYTQDDLALLVDLWLSGWTGTMHRNTEQERKQDPEEHVSLWAAWLSSIQSRKLSERNLRRSKSCPEGRESAGSESGLSEEHDRLRFTMTSTRSWSSSKGATFDAMATSFSTMGVSSASWPNLLWNGSRRQKVQLLRPVTSLKRFELWPWALRFDDVVLKQLQAEYLMHPEVLNTIWPPSTVWWLPDKHAPFCGYCHRDFSLFRRRHHCRACGHIFCRASTCLTRAVIPSLGYSSKVYMCRRCLEDKMFVENNDDDDQADPTRKASKRRHSSLPLLYINLPSPTGPATLAPAEELDEVQPKLSNRSRSRRATVLF